MVRLTADMIARSPAFLNAMKDRELDLRGNKIAVIENLAATQDQFDVIDLSDNEIKKVECMAVLKRLNTLLLHNNRVTRISESLGKTLPNLTALVLTNNLLSTLTELEPLASASSLTSLVLVDNPVTKVKDYRTFIIAMLPRLRVLDYKRVSLAERHAAEAGLRQRTKRVGGGMRNAEDGASVVAGAAGGADADVAGASALKAKPTEEQVAKIKLAIANATSLEEMQRLEKALKSGNFEIVTASERPDSVSEGGAGDDVGA